jgi:hypothetical protein
MKLQTMSEGIRFVMVVVRDRDAIYGRALWQQKIYIFLLWTFRIERFFMRVQSFGYFRFQCEADQQSLNPPPPPIVNFVSTGRFFYFGLFDMPIIWSFFWQKLSSWTFFISIFQSYFVKKFQNFSAITYFCFKKMHQFW